MRVKGDVGVAIGVGALASSKLFHFHIPKTAGTALRAWFVAQCGEDDVSPGLVGMLMHDALLRWENRTVISGHFQPHQGDELPRDRFSLVVLRNPAARFLSEYWFWRNHNDARLLDARQRVSDLDMHIRLLDQRGPEHAALQIGMLYPLGTRSEEHLSSSERLAAAKLALDRFELVGVQESLDDFACMIAARMDWPQRDLLRHNVTQHKDAMNDLAAEQRRRITALLESEIELYEYARQRFRNDRRQAIVGGRILRADTAMPARVQPAAPARTTPREFGDRQCEILRAEVRGRLSGPPQIPPQILCGEEIELLLEIAAHAPIGELTIGFAFRDERGALLFGTNSLLLGNAYQIEPGKYLARFAMLNRLGPGHYRVDASLIRGLSHYDGCYHWHEQAAYFEVCDVASAYFEGRVMLDPDFNLTAVDGNGQVRRSPAQSEHAMVRSFGRTNLPLTQFHAEIELLSPMQVLPAATNSILQLRVQNLGEETWPAGGRDAPVCLTYRWYSAAGELLVADGLRSTLPGDLPAGRAIIAPLLVHTPDDQGAYQLVVSLVQEGVAWFIEMDPESGCRIDVDVA